MDNFGECHRELGRCCSTGKGVEQLPLFHRRSLRKESHWALAVPKIAPRGARRAYNLIINCSQRTLSQRQAQPNFFGVSKRTLAMDDLTLLVGISTALLGLGILFLFQKVRRLATKQLSFHLTDRTACLMTANDGE